MTRSQSWERRYYGSLNETEEKHEASNYTLIFIFGTATATAGQRRRTDEFPDL